MLDYPLLSSSLILFLHHYRAQLHCLDLKGTMAFQHVLEACLACTVLRMLNLRATADCSGVWNEADKDVERLAAAVPQWYTPLPHLTFLSIRGVFFTEPHMLAILAACPCVTYLRLRPTADYRALPLTLSALPVIGRSCPRLQHMEVTRIADTFFLPASGAPSSASASVPHLLAPRTASPSCFPCLDTLVLDSMVCEHLVGRGKPPVCLYSVPAVAALVSLLSSSPLRTFFLGLSLSLSDLALLAPLPLPPCAGPRPATELAYADSH